MPITPGAHVNPSVRLVRPLGHGGMGSVWVAEHLALQTQVVVKFMSTELAKVPSNVQRFAREAAAASQVKSPHVVQMFDHGVTTENVPYIVMELLEGKDLAHHIVARGRLAPGEVSTVLTQVCKALSKAHEKGIVHRDIKPENIFVLDGDELYVKLLDFGIAKGTGALANHTGTGSMIGTPYYMSPEQILGAKTIDFRADIWSLGIVAFEALTGHKPIQADTIGALAVKIHGGQLPRPSEHGLPPAIDAWFGRACASDPNARFQSAKEMAIAFAAATGGAPSVEMSALPQHAPAPVHSQSSGWGATPPPSQRPPVNLIASGQHAPPPPPPPPAYAPNTHFESSATPSPEPAKRSKMPLIIVLVLLLVAMSVGGFAVFNKLSEQPSNAGKVEEEETPAEAPSKKKKKAKAVETNEEPQAKPPEKPPEPIPEPTAKKASPPPPASTVIPPPLPPPIKTATPPPPPKKNNDDDIK